MDISKSLAELVAMRARGELTAEQFEQAKLLLQNHKEPPQHEILAANPVAPPATTMVAPTKKKGGCRKAALWLAVIFLVIPVAVGVIGQLMMSPEERAKQAAEQAQQAEVKKVQEQQEAEEAKKKAAEEAKEASLKAQQDAVAEAEKKKSGLHCLSGWDGSDRDLVNAVKAQMREPDSFEHIETRIAPVDKNGQNTIIMQFRARNGFGGMNVGMATGVLNNVSCSLVSWELISS